MQASQKKKRNFTKSLRISHCSACLCTDRKLVVLVEYLEIYQQICTNIVQGIKTSEILLCWECLALLRKVQKFQEKVFKSHETLKRYLKNGKNIFLKHFSSLTSTKPYIFNSKEIVMDVDLSDVKPETIDIKLENNDGHDSYYEFEPVPLEEIKDDSPERFLEELQEIPIDIDRVDFNGLKNETLKQTEIITENLFEKHEQVPIDINPNSPSNCDVKPDNDIKKEFRPTKPTKNKEPVKRIWLKTDRSKLYKISGQRKDTQANCYSRFPIQPHEVNYWMERERNSVYYKNLKKKCDKCVSRIVSAKKHKERHSKDRKYICDFCSLSFEFKGGLKIHVKNHLYVRQCNVCGYKCIGKLHMYKHSRKEHGAVSLRVVQCLSCDATFSKAWEFYKHYRQTHYELKSVFYCDHCNRRFLQRHTIERHIIRQHSPQVCKACGVTFKSYSGLQQHQQLKHRVDRTEASYCVQCDRQFDNVARFKQHTQNSAAHAGERNKPNVVKKQRHQCPACPNTYAKITYMRNHYNRIHTPVARFSCQQCDKTFSTNSHLQDHLKYSHQGYARPKNKICNICGRGFTTNPVLVKHMRTHTGERPYHCPHCESKFAQRTAMLTHIKSIHIKRERKLIALP